MMSDPGRSLVLAQVTGVKDNNLVYPSCYQCYSKVYRRQDAEQNLWQCLKCKTVHTEADIYERYRLHLSITDDSTICDVTVFGTNLDELFGCSAAHFKKSVNIECDDTEGLLASSLEEVFVGRFFLFGFKSSPIRRRDSERFFRAPITLARVISSNNRGHGNVNTQQSSPTLVAYQMIPMQESVNKSDFPTVVQVLRRKILTRCSTSSQLCSNVTKEELLQQSDTNVGLTSTYPLSDQSGVNLTMSFMQSSTRNSINMTYGQPSVLLSCDRENCKTTNMDRNHVGDNSYFDQKRLSSRTMLSQGSQLLNSNVKYQRCNDLSDQISSLGSSFTKHCSVKDNLTLDVCEMNFDQSMELESRLTNEDRVEEIKGDCHANILERSPNYQVDRGLIGIDREENGDVHFDADDFDETFDPNEVDPQDIACLLTAPHVATVIESPKDREPQKSSTSTHHNLTETLSDSCDSDSDSLLLLAFGNGEGIGDQNVNGSIRIPITIPAPKSDEDRNSSEQDQHSSEAGCHNPKDCVGSKGVSNGSLTNLSGSQETITDVQHRRDSMDHVVTDSQNGDFGLTEEEMPFSEDLDAFLQDMSYSQAECSQKRLPNDRTEANSSPLKETLSHTSSDREELESCLSTRETFSTQSRALNEKDVQHTGGSLITQNDTKTSNTSKEEVTHLKQEVDPLENGSEELFFTQDMSQLDNQVEIKSELSLSGGHGTTTDSQSMVLFSGSELFSESCIDYEADTENGSCTDSNNEVFYTGSETKVKARVCSQETKVHSEHRAIHKTPRFEKLSSRAKNVQFAGSLTEARDIAHIDLKMKTEPAPVAKTRRKSCLKSGVSFVPISISPLQVLQVSSPDIISTQMDLFSPSPEVVLRQQIKHGLNSTFHSTPVITNKTLSRRSEKGALSLCSSPNESSDIIPSSTRKPSRPLQQSSKSEGTKAKHSPADKENGMGFSRFQGIRGLTDSSNIRRGHSNLHGEEGTTRELNKTIDSLQSQEMSQDLFSSAQSGDLFSDCSWEDDLDVCKKLF